VAKAYQLTDTDDLQTVEKWIVVADVPFEVIFRREVIAVRAAELLSLHRTFGRGLVERILPSYSVFTKVEIKMVSCLQCNGVGNRKVGEPCLPCNGRGQVKAEVIDLDIDRPGGYEDRRLDQARTFIKEEIDEEIGFDRNKDCPDKTTERRIGYNGDCEGCPHLLREEITNDDFDVIGCRWMCKKRQKEVRVAERLMENEGQDVKA
jgi:hypothetical protein